MFSCLPNLSTTQRDRKVTMGPGLSYAAFTWKRTWKTPADSGLLSADPATCHREAVTGPHPARPRTPAEGSLRHIGFPSWRTKRRDSLRVLRPVNPTLSGFDNVDEEAPVYGPPWLCYNTWTWSSPRNPTNSPAMRCDRLGPTRLEKIAVALPATIHLGPAAKFTAPARSNQAKGPYVIHLCRLARWNPP